MTYDEMDRNQSQFFYSASLNSTGTSMLLHYTGSSALDTGGISYGPRSITIPFPSVDIDIPEAIAAGNDTEIQFNKEGGFGASPNLVFDRDKNAVGIAGNPAADFKLSIFQETSRPASIKLTALSTLVDNRAETAFFLDSTDLGGIGKTVGSDNNNLYFSNRFESTTERSTYGKLHFSIPGAGDTDDNGIIATVSKNNDIKSVGIGTTTPNRQLSIVGAEGLGISATSTNENASFLRPIPSDLLQQTNSDGSRSLVPRDSSDFGLLISSPAAGGEGGNVVVAVNTDGSEKEAFNIISVRENDFSDAKARVLASFGVDKKAGIGTQDVNLTGLTVEGNISSSLNLYIGNTDTAASYSSSAVIAVDSIGKVEKAEGALTPIGGIIIWSGASDGVPNGWRLCNGQNGTPDLRNRFIVGAGDTYSVGGSGGSADAVIVSHTHTATVTDPGHNHTFTQEDARGSGAAGSEDGNSSFGLVSTNSSTTGISVSINTTGSSATNANLPPYYSLAYIMYVGS